MINFSINHPKRTLWLMLGFMFLCAAFVPLIEIDTDPENMLSKDEEVRVKHNELKEKFDMHDMLVIGVVNNDHPEGVFNQASLTDIFELSKYAYTLQTENEEGEFEGVIQRDVLTPTNSDYIASMGDGSIKFDWVMSEAPKNEAEALNIKKRLMENELFYNTMVSEDGKALALYLPISSKDQSYTLADQLQTQIATLSGGNDYHITGLPVAEDTFGIEMFIQMAIAAPAAMILIFILMMLFFRKFRLVLSPLIVAMVSVICTMGLLIGTGNTVHIMSSMIPIFIMPIAVLDGVHILSEFYDRYQETGDRRKTIEGVISDLYKPMLFTSLTSAAGFASLAITPIPPVQVFGIFVGLGILFAWFFTMTFIPAYIMMTSEETLADFGHASEKGHDGLLGRVLSTFQKLTFGKAGLVVGLLAFLTALSGYGISKIQINDNPVKWFTKSHPIRVADKELNDHFGGTYMAYLNFDASADEAPFSKETLWTAIEAKFKGTYNETQLQEIKQQITATQLDTSESPYVQLSDAFADMAYENEDDDDLFDYYESISDAIALREVEIQQVFKQPEVLNYLLDLEKHLYDEGGVGKSTSVAKIVRTVNKKLQNDQPDQLRVPSDVGGVGQCIVSYQNSHIPEMLWHFVSPDFKSVNLWLQLKSGDNKDMEKTMNVVNEYIANNPPPVTLDKSWFGLTYINVVWQQKMVQGMLEAFLGSFIVVFLMMIFLFRSIKWATLSMMPLSLTILIIYGVIGWIGKDYDMPVAVLSSLVLGLAVDFAIHFIARSRASLQKTNDWAVTSKYMFGEPSRAISRNVIIIAVGFLPLLLANLIPYRTVGLILAAILLLSGIITLLLLPALIKILGIKK